MNKLLLADKGRNHIKIFPLYKDVEIPTDEGDKIRWAKARFEELQNANDANRLFICKNVKKGILISVWELNGLYYLIQCIRNEFKTYNVTVYIHNEKEDSLNIAHFLRAHMYEIMEDYKNQILEARDYLLNEREKHTESN